MHRWSRLSSFLKDNENQEEKWLYDSESERKEYLINASFGKSVNFLSLKKPIINDFSHQLSTIKNRVSSLYKPENLEDISNCPICNSSLSNSKKLFAIYGVHYFQCSECLHSFVKQRPTLEILNKFYEDDVGYQGTYADKKNLDIRIQDVVMPKVKWVMKEFERAYKRKPLKILDVGAGSGHFVYACRHQGLNADGVELSASGKDFCEKNFGFSLIKDDFIKNFSRFSEYDCITFWGVIEHIPYPIHMLQAAFNILKNKEGLIVAEVPRWESLTTVVQSFNTDNVVRHLDPSGHIHCFTDSSLSTAFKLSGFQLFGAWYYGMDAYELFMQLSIKRSDDQIIKSNGENLNLLQKKLDGARLSDFIALSGKSI
ncbi:class I SAM-dependent methyltransferase [Candidatus Babeliales bacterium]|nr:class I SAM-dependent methyltransferase [Candidatus Babeliales bacterium]